MGTDNRRAQKVADRGYTQNAAPHLRVGPRSMQEREFDFDFILEKPATRPRDRCGKEQLVYPFVTGSPGSSRVSALAPYSSGGRVGSTLSTPHAGGDLGLFVGECSSPQTDAPKQRRGMSHQRPDLSSHPRAKIPDLTGMGLSAKIFILESRPS